MIAKNFWLVKKNIAAACASAGKNPDDITLVAVSKTVEQPDILKALDVGICHFGESKVQELCRKFTFSHPRLQLHYIGRLQSNKVKDIIDKVCLIQSLDRLSLAQEIEKQASKRQMVMPVLVQVNIGEEPQKGGVMPQDFLAFLKDLAPFAHLQVRGLMVIPPICSDSGKTRAYFKKAKALFDQARQAALPHIFMEILSMGMSHDYVLAIEEGATMVRIGTGLFGPRKYADKGGCA